MSQQEEGGPSGRGQGSQPLVMYLVAAGMGSRRSAAAQIMGGRVQVNGEAADRLTQPVGPRDHVSVNGRQVQASHSKAVYLLLHKPAGYLTSVRDERGRPTVLDLVPPGDRAPGLVPVGRLDLETTGLVLLTNDGQLVYRLTHPRFGVEKEYHVLLNGQVTSSQRRQLLAGVRLPTGLARAVTVRPLTLQSSARSAWPGRAPRAAALGRARYEVILLEGQKREMRLMFRAIGLSVLELRRVRLGTLRLGTLTPHQVRRLTPVEVQRLKDLVYRSQDATPSPIRQSHRAGTVRPDGRQHGQLHQSHRAGTVRPDGRQHGQLHQSHRAGTVRPDGRQHGQLHQSHRAGKVRPDGRQHGQLH